MLSTDKLYRLKKYLNNAINKKLSRIDCAELISISKNILIPYLRNTKSSFLKLSEIHGLDINDLAIEILGEVFRQNNDGKLVNIFNFISKLFSDINSINDENLFWAYQSFLRKMADIHIARSYAELDPNGFKIQRNIKETLPTQVLELRKSILVTMIYVKNSEEHDFLPYLSIEEFEKDFLINIAGKVTTAELLESVHSLLQNCKNSRKGISLIDAVGLFKKHYKIDQEIIHEEESLEMIFTDSFIDKFEIDQLCSKVMDKIKGKIFIDYFSKAKLTKEQATALYSAVNDIVFDLLNMGKNHISYYDYLTKYIKIEHEEYELKFKSKLEYIIKQVKESFRNYFYTKE